MSAMTSRVVSEMTAAPQHEATAAPATEPTDGQPGHRPRRRQRLSVDDLLTGLNPSQREAVVHEGAPVLVVAGAVAGGLFVVAFNLCQNRLRIDDVLGVWPLHGLCGLWGGIAAGIFGSTALGGMGGVSFMAQLVGSLLGAAYAFAAGGLVYLVLKMLFGIRLTDEEEHLGADLAIHKIGAYPEDDMARPR